MSVREVKTRLKIHSGEGLYELTRQLYLIGAQNDNGTPVRCFFHVVVSSEEDGRTYQWEEALRVISATRDGADGSLWNISGELMGARNRTVPIPEMAGRRGTFTGVYRPDVLESLRKGHLDVTYVVANPSGPLPSVRSRMNLSS